MWWMINTTHTVSAKTFNTSQTFAFWSFGTSHIFKHNDFFFPPGFPATPLFSNMSVHHHLFVRLQSQRTGPNKICSVQKRGGGEGRRREGGGLFVRGVIFDTLMNSFKRFSKYGLMRAGRGCHLGFICEAFPWFLPYSRQPCLLCKWQWFIG